MATGFYIGVDGKARKVKGGYIGVDGVARKIKKGYIGDANGVARLCWSAFDGDPVFANNTWENIALACQLNAVPDSWLVGDQKTMTVNGVDYTIDVIGKNHDDYADGSGKAPLTFQLHECYSSGYGMNNTSSNSGSWGSSAMRTSRLTSIFQLLPSEVQSAIREVSKLTANGFRDSTITTTADKLFLLSEIEVFNIAEYSHSGEGNQYEYYAKGNSKQKQYVDSTVNKPWWFRSPSRTSGERFVVKTADGTDATQANADTEYGVSFAFCF